MKRKAVGGRIIMKGKWKTVDIGSADLTTIDETGGLVLFEELDNYELLTTDSPPAEQHAAIAKKSAVLPKPGKVQQGKGEGEKKGKKRKSQSYDEEKEPVKKKKKSRQKKKKKVKDKKKLSVSPETETQNDDGDDGDNNDDDGDGNDADGDGEGDDDASEKIGDDEFQYDEDEKWREVDMSPWLNLYVPEPILHGLVDLGFTTPTDIQTQCLPAAIRDYQDIIGAAETGSGKTLAFGIPILHHILNIQEREERKKDKRFDTLMNDNDDTPNPSDKLLALILTPTRELAIQVQQHLTAVSKHTDIKIAVVVGGMSAQKQERILKKKPQIVIATPGRLWELIQHYEPHLSTVNEVKYLVIDEADRMVEKGHYAELSLLLDLINGSETPHKRQTFIFSATLTMVHLGPHRNLMKKKKYKINKEQKLDSLITEIGLREDHMKVVDLTKKDIMVKTLTEARIHCAMEEKDYYLYYFLLQYPGRTLVFTNSIDCIRRLISILTLLQRQPLPLHADMHQKQRLKNLERFSSNPNGLLLATDVAARGLDIPNVQHVVHYQVPRTTETYVHRSGRTARATKEGLSLMLAGPDDSMHYRRLIKTLDRDEDIAMFPIERRYLSAVKERVNATRMIDTMEHRYMKKKRQNDWFIRNAQELDIELDDELCLQDIGDNVEQKEHEKHLKLQKKSLRSMLQKAIFPKGYSVLYPTRGGHLSMPKIHAASRHAAMSAIQAVKQDMGEQTALAKSIRLPRKQKTKPKRNKRRKK
ncbi:ATP-dependent RNA helicase DDX24-like isoform X1 [Glandiceps talaboti]